MAEAFRYRREEVTDENGNVVDYATFRIPNPSRAEGASATGVTGGTPTGRQRLDWSNAEYRGASAGGRVRQYIRSAAGRGAARNPVMRTNRYGI